MLNATSVGGVVLRPHFRDRTDAGDALALSLNTFAGERGVVVLGLARGGVPVARQVAAALGASLGTLVSRKIGVPGIEDVALGAIAEGSRRAVHDAVAWYIGVPADVVDQLAVRERVEIERRVQLYRGGEPLPDLRGRTVILVDDGLATGASLRAAARSVRGKRPKRLIAAVPIATPSGAKEVRPDVDELVSIVTTEEFETVAASYGDYSPVTDDEVLALLGRPARRAPSSMVNDISSRIAPASSSALDPSSEVERTVEISASGSVLMADLGGPRHVDGDETDGVRGLVILANGGESSRNSYRSRYIAGRLRAGGYATLRVDLLTQDEQCGDRGGADVRRDVEQIAARLSSVCDWAVDEAVHGVDNTILIGASTGAAAVFVTAARRPQQILAVVSRGGRADLAGEALSRVETPSLLIVGAADVDTLRRNNDVLRQLPNGAQLVRIPRAGNTFAEPGALGAVAEHTLKWLDRLERK
ncbi:MAG: phosphoribosyltransferase family protein [bacterium]